MSKKHQRKKALAKFRLDQILGAPSEFDDIEKLEEMADQFTEERETRIRKHINNRRNRNTR